MNELRQTIMSQGEIVGRKQRFALFSQPTSLAIGDNSYYNNKTARKGEDGKPITLPRNLLAGANKSGVSKRDFITATGSIYVGDQYMDPEKVEHLNYKKLHTKAQFHQLEFKPSSGPRTLAASSYNYVEEKPQNKSKPARDETGRVITKDKNVTSNSMSKIQRQFFKPLKHIADPYERKDMFESQEKRLSKSKMGQEIYRTMSHGDLLFSSHKRIYGQDDKAKEIMKSKSPFVQFVPRVTNHDNTFKLARRGHGDTIGKYPEFIAPPQSKSEIIKKINKEKKQQQAWKPSGNKSLSRPTPSISYSSFSLRKHM